MAMVKTMRFEEITENFRLLDDWEDRYRYLIDLGRDLTPLSEAERSLETKVRGCASQVWLVSQTEGVGPDAVLAIRGDSDAHIVRGLIAVLLALYSGKTARSILATDAGLALNELGLGGHLTPQRSNGFASMVTRIKADAQAAAAA